MLVLDFGGAVRPADRAPRARVPRVLRARSPHDTPADEIVAREPLGIILSGGPASVYEPRARRRSIRACSTSGSRCSASATACRPWRSRSAARSGGPARPSSARPPLETQPDARAVPRAGRRAELLDEPQRLGRPACRPASASPPRRGNAPIAAMESAERGLYAVQFHPEVVAHAGAARTSSRTSSTAAARRRATWTAAHVIEEQVARIRAAGRLRARHLRAVRRRRLGRRGAARPQGGRRPADVRLRRPRAAPRRARPSRSSRRSAATSRCRSCTSQAQERFLVAPGRRDRSRDEAQDHRRDVHPRLRGRGHASSTASTSWCRARSTPT